VRNMLTELHALSGACRPHRTGAAGLPPDILQQYVSVASGDVPILPQAEGKPGGRMYLLGASPTLWRLPWISEPVLLADAFRMVRRSSGEFIGD
jgi:hypothetical protein